MPSYRGEFFYWLVLIFTHAPPPTPYVSGHKLYGPKGIGALYVRRRPRVRLEAVFSGGGQERGIRSGTLPTSMIVGLGAACRIAAEDMQKDSKW